MTRRVPMPRICPTRLTEDMEDELGGDEPLHVTVISADRRVQRALVQLIGAAHGLSVLPAGAVPAELTPDVAVVDADPAAPHAAPHALATVRRLVEAQVPVLALAGNAARRTEALAAGAAACVDKLCEPETILTTLRQLADRTHSRPA